MLMVLHADSRDGSTQRNWTIANNFEVTIRLKVREDKQTRRNESTNSNDEMMGKLPYCRRTCSYGDGEGAKPWVPHLQSIEMAPGVICWRLDAVVDSPIGTGSGGRWGLGRLLHRTAAGGAGPFLAGGGRARCLIPSGWRVF